MTVVPSKSLTMGSCMLVPAFLRAYDYQQCMLRVPSGPESWCLLVLPCQPPRSSVASGEAAWAPKAGCAGVHDGHALYHVPQEGVMAERICRGGTC